MGACVVHAEDLILQLFVILKIKMLRPCSRAVSREMPIAWD